MNAAATFLLLASLALSAASPQDVFTDAKQDYRSLRSDSRRRLQRAPYEKIIRQLKSASRRNVEMAPECAFFAATIAEDLYLASGVAADLDQAIDLNVTVADRFPASSLADDALLRAARLALGRKGDREGARLLLLRARKEHPRGDQRHAVAELLARVPADTRAEEPRPAATPAPDEDDSRERLAAIISKVTQEVQQEGGTVSVDVGGQAVDPNDPVAIKEAELTSGKRGSRLVVPVEGEVTVSTGTVPASRGMPYRFYADIAPATAGGIAKALKGLKDARIKGARAAQFDARTVRVVLELKDEIPAEAAYDATEKQVVITLGRQAVPASLPVVRVEPPGHGHSHDEEEHPTPKGVVLNSSPDAGPTLTDVKSLAKDFADRPEVSISAQTGLKVRRVVIDAGHGGKDTGAIGPTGLREKDITLKIAKKVAARLRKELKMEVILTRDKDVYIPLEERTKIANDARADLFISIHCNSNPNRRIHGVETYYLNITDDNYAMRLAARENRTSERSISDLQFILADLAMKSNVDDSVRLSKLVQTNVVGELRDHYSHVKDLGVKHALFYVLIGAKMPAILVETSFVSNRKEEKRLKSSRYQDRISDGIVQGVRNFMEERQALAH